ncbi:MAG: hypothetical protein M1839_009269 [Geoglossum umbratile]|nr:MAG: hypothetical protein M1839_009269 [Geoglossum umbratile]
MPPSGPFPFLSLPPEIRNKIYRHLLTSPQTLTSPQRPSAHFIQNHLQPGILATSRQVHNEALRILYEENRVEVYVSDDAVHLPTSSARNLDLVLAFNVMLEVSPARGMVTRERVEELVGRLARCPRIVDLRVEIPWRPTPARMHMIKVRRLLEPFKMLRGVGRVEFVGCMKPLANRDFKRVMESQDEDPLPPRVD